MVYPQGEGSDPFDASKKDQPGGSQANEGQPYADQLPPDQQYPSYQNPQFETPQSQTPQYGNPGYGSPQYPNQQYPYQQYGNAQFGGAPYAGAGYQPAASTNTLAIVSMVLGALGLTFVPVIASVCAVVCGHIARGQIRRTGESGSGFATAGLIIGYISIVLGVIIVGAFVLFVLAASTY